MSKVTFYPLKNVSIIVFDNEIAGKLAFNDDNEIVALDIQGWFYHKIKHKILDAILFHFGIDSIILKH